MTKGRRFLSLQAKLFLTLALALVLSIGFSFCGRLTMDLCINTFYLSPGAIQNRTQEHVSALRTYVSENKLTSNNTQAMASFCRERRTCSILIYGQNTMLDADADGASLMAYGGMVMNTAAGTSQEGTYVVNFADGAYSVHVSDHSERQLYTIRDLCVLLLGCAVFVIVMLLYSRKLTDLIQSLSRRVGQVSQGDLTLEITPVSRDEIGELAMDVDAMRLSIIDKLQREERAWQANSQLITAISHDVRTPLTTLMGYLDILVQDPDLPPEARESYLNICRRKAENLRELTDELFAYFLVLGTPEPETHLELLDAGLLLAQLLGEFCEELSQQDLLVEPAIAPLEGNVRADVQHLRRIFSNLQSNLRKYADPAVPITVEAGPFGDLARISIKNGVKEDAGAVESTRIGLQTCQRLAAAMGGEFRKRQEDGTFTVELFLPLLPSQSEGEADGEALCEKAP